jgi:hypothetical protein
MKADIYYLTKVSDNYLVQVDSEMEKEYGSYIGMYNTHGMAMAAITAHIEWMGGTYIDSTKEKDDG